MEYRERHMQRRKHKYTYEEVMGYLKREMKRRMIADGLIIDPRNAPPRYKWEWTYADHKGEVEANTRGEARSRIKAALGIRKKRLPLGVIITRKDNESTRTSTSEVA
jgi:hypothetical protein